MLCKFSRSWAAAIFIVVATVFAVRLFWSGRLWPAVALPRTEEAIKGRDVHDPLTDRQQTTEVTADMATHSAGAESAVASSTQVSKFADKPATPPEVQHMPNSSRLAMNLVVLHFMRYDPNVSKQKLLDRETEYMTALQRNLNHNLVARVHILTTDSNVTEKRLLDFDLPHRHKIVVAQVPSADSTRDMFEYISQNLVGQDVMYVNGDIYLTEGFDKVDAQAMRQRHIIYGLTRRGKQEAKCRMRDYCGVNVKHSVGSHDAFLFHLMKPIPENALQDLEYKLGSAGSENVLLWMFKYRLKYCVLNPCRILKAYHLHCTNLRTSRFRVNTSGKSVAAPFTDELIC